MSAQRVLVEVNEQGRMTLPAKVRAALGIEGHAQVELELEDGSVRLRPTVVVPREDSWAYSKAHMELVHRALADVEAGRFREGTPEDIAARAGG
jgi:AbrB family looped-hinge helix DNA binding protein